MPGRFMKDVQELAPAWTLPRGTAMRLPAQRLPACLRVVEGMVWLTADAPGPSGDHWLRAGERFVLPAGVSVVVEGGPQARFELLLTPAWQPARSFLRRVAALRASRQEAACPVPSGAA